MSDILIRRQHGMQKDQARQAAEEIADNLKERLQADYRWEGDHLRFKRSGAEGHIHVTEGEVEIAIKLGLMFRPMKGLIEGKITEFLDKRLT